MTSTAKIITGLAALTGLVLAAEINRASGSIYAVYLALGGALGLVLYHASFAFTGAWKRLISEKKSAGFRAQLVMFLVAITLFFPALGGDGLFGMAAMGAVAPAGFSVLIGAFLFGLGMQFGGSCASGTLYVLGGGSGRMIITLTGFIIGSVVATHDIYWWWSLPSLGAVSLPRTLGVFPALALNFAVLGGLYFLVRQLERLRHGRVEPIFGTGRTNHGPDSGRFFRGPWPLIWGAIGLAVLNFATLIISGRPWGITWAFALWGAKGALALGIDIESWQFWAVNRASLYGNVLGDQTSVMNFGIILGALLAAGLQGKFRFRWRYSLPSLASALVGGLFLGYGARLAFGCNIGALFSGIASGSLHGWLWLFAGFSGNYAGARVIAFLGRSARGRVGRA